MDYKKTILLIESKRKEKGLSITELCQKSGVLNSTYSRILSNKTTNPNINTIKQLCDVLGLKITIS